MAVTIKQIAELAGVSRGTVDRALNDRGGVSAEVERQIKSIAKKLDYKPNPMAKALANSRKKLSIGVLVNSGKNPFFDKVMLGIEKAGAEIGSFNISLVIKELTGYNVTDQLSSIDELAQANINGLVITPINDLIIADRLNKLAQDGISIVTLNSDISGVDKLCFVGCDYVKSGQTAAELLGQITHSTAKVGIITGSEKMLGHTKRVSGFKKVLHDSYNFISVAGVCETFDDDVRAYMETKHLLDNHHDITALYFCAGGIDGGMKAVSDSEFSSRLKIITVDDTDNIKNYIKEGKVNMTVCQQPFKQGYDSIKFAFDKIVDNKNPPRKHMYTQNEVKTRYNLD